MKLVVNHCHGGFGLSHEAMMLYAEKKGITLYPYQQKDGLRGSYFRYTPSELLQSRMLHASYVKEDGGEEMTYAEFNTLYNRCGLYGGDVGRDDAALIATVEQLGEKANGGFANLQIVEISDGVKWEISEYDGYESVEEQHRSW